MQRAHARLTDVPGLDFYRLMGSGGGNGFGLSPNWGVYAFVGKWSGAEEKDRFFTDHDWLADVRQHSDYQLSCELEATLTHGKWGGTNPFLARPEGYDAREPVAVITRATIRPRKLLDFWRYVPRTSASVYDHPDRLLSVGIGEYPVFMQATFSIWRSGAAMSDFAYSSKHHREVVRLTRERDWYREELFTRFRLTRIQGSWPGFDPSALLLKSDHGPD
jgi:hypothetical protein